MLFPPLAELLPHRAPMVVLEGVLAFEPPTIVCSVAKLSDSLFVTGDKVRAVVSLEYMAQCIAAYSSLVEAGSSRRPRPGYVVAVRDLELNCAYFRADDELLAEATALAQNGKTSLFSCRVLRAGETVARAELTVQELS